MPIERILWRDSMRWFFMLLKGVDDFYLSVPRLAGCSRITPAKMDWVSTVWQLGVCGGILSINFERRMNFQLIGNVQL